MRHFRFFTIVCSLTLALAAPSWAAPDELAAAIAQGNAAYISALTHGSAADLAALFTDDATQLPSSAGPVRGREAIRASYERTFRSTHVSSAVLRTSDIIRRGDMAYETGEYAFDIEHSGTYSHVVGRYLTVWRKLAGVWKIDLSLGQQDAPIQ